MPKPPLAPRLDKPKPTREYHYEPERMPLSYWVLLAVFVAMCVAYLLAGWLYLVKAGA